MMYLYLLYLIVENETKESHSSYHMAMCMICLLFAARRTGLDLAKCNY